MRRRFVPVILVVLLGGFLFAADVFAASPTLPGAPIVGIAGKCLDNYHNNRFVGNKVDLFPCNATTAQNWSYTSTQQLEVDTSDLCMSVTTTASSAGFLIDMEKCSATPSQQWTIDKTNNTIKSVLNNYCLDSQWGGTKDYNTIWVWPCNNTAAQTWTVGQGAFATTTTTARSTTTTVKPTTTTTAKPVSTSSGEGIIVPAYFYPNASDPNDAWYRMCNTLRAGSIIIINMDNGPQGLDSNNSTVFKYCVDKGMKLVGYDDTAYAKTSLSTVEGNVTLWYSEVPGIAGIMLDEMSDDPNTASYYKSVYTMVHGKGGIVVGNPGDAASTNWQLSVLDIDTVFEGSASTYANTTFPGWVLSAPKGKIANVVYGAPDNATMLRAVSESKTRNIGWLYVTNDVEPNPYDVLPAPSYWNAEVSAVG